VTPPDPSRREFLRRTGAVGVALGLGEWAAACASADGPPNVVLIFMDDMGYGDVGTYGASGYVTPNLDRLAAEGMRFTDFYASQAVCSASRASLLTGCYSERVGIQGALGPAAEHGLAESETTIAEMLKAQGYATAMVGKWHLGNWPPFLPLQNGFDEYLGLPYSNDMWPVNYDGTPATSGNKLRYPPLPLIDGNDRVETIETLDDQDTLTTRYTERALDFLDRKAEAGPFFLYVAHSMPHVPLGVSSKYRGDSERGMFGDVIEEIDWSVGRILEALDRHGVADDTIVIFTSDNGPWLNFGNHAGSTGGLREGKGTAFEGGPRVPAIVRWPGHVEPGSVCRRMASTLDILPTLAAATGAALPPLEIDGVSILPLLEGEPGANPRNVFWFYYGHELRGVREGRWKRVYEHRTRSYVGVEPGMDGFPGPYAFPTVPDALYDLETDVAETTDVSAEHPDIVARLDAIAEEARATLGDRLTGRVGAEERAPGRRDFDRPDDVAHLGVGAAITLTDPPSPRYPGDSSVLVDGRFASRDHTDSRWLGFTGVALEATIDLGEPKRIGRVALDCLQAQEPWIFLPKSVEVSTSADGETWTRAGSVESGTDEDRERKAVPMEVRFPAAQVRHVRVRATSHTLPDWHVGHGEDAWIFADEILIEEA
jgi:arylsulfatase